MLTIRAPSTNQQLSVVRIENVGDDAVRVTTTLSDGGRSIDLLPGESLVKTLAPGAVVEVE